MTKKLRVEFFHDVICSACFPMSYRMRQLQQQLPELEIVHRSFALVRKPEDFDAMFGSREQAKKEILTHWVNANQNDDLHRFNIKGLRESDFPFPTSMNALYASKAAWFVGGGEESYWDVFDALQKAFFMDVQNIELDEVIEVAVQTTGIDITAWRRFYRSEEVKQAVEKDLELVRQHNLYSIPTLVVNGRHLINGALPLETLKERLEKIEEQETVAVGESCEFQAGKFVCD